MILINNKTKFNKVKGSNSTPATTDNVKVGTLITFAYSYNSRIPKFARVIKRMPSSVKIEYLSTQNVEDDGYGQNGRCIANLDGPTQQESRSYRFKAASGRLYIDNHPCYIYDGFPEDFYTD